MHKEYFKDFDKIKAPESAVNKAVNTAFSEDITKENYNYKTINLRKRFVPLLAACFLLVFAGTFVFGLCSDFVTGNKSENNVSDDINYGFVIKANSAKSKDKAVIGAYSGTMTGGWAMYENFENGKGFSPNYFQSYGFSHFGIEGEGIKSVTFKTDTEGVYFAISPAGYYLNADEESTAQKVREESENYYDIYLTKSQYSAKELKEYSDGLSYGDMYCDTFKYTNNSDENIISFSNKLELVIESNHNNKQVSEKLDRIWQCEQELTEIRSHHTAESGVLTEREVALYEELEILSQDIRKLVISDATMEVLVEFEDGSVQKKILKLGLEIIEGQGMWLTISE